MKKTYTFPEFTIVEIRMTDILAGSPLEETLPEVIVGGGEGGDLEGGL